MDIELIVTFYNFKPNSEVKFRDNNLHEGLVHVSVKPCTITCQHTLDGVLVPTQTVYVTPQSTASFTFLIFSL